jgi:hypothetical protein
LEPNIRCMYRTYREEGPQTKQGRYLFRCFILGEGGTWQSNRRHPCAGNRKLCIAPHPHAQESATRHVEDVAKKEPSTCKQTQNNNPTTKQHLHLNPSCAALETFTSRKGQIEICKQIPLISRTKTDLHANRNPPPHIDNP